ncbi:tyrosine-type recombinase/integrase [Streptomyces sp. H10-C2]|uniref:site-specific integrase n=1 Tax=unclassified Streptomyces TaxID=2593676 RepID=UPI0024B8C55E|nr:MULTISPECIES: site-specific integrase [unclassified Streptomyces]MDJ0340822.1 tyrosine-type recombinase/integrase [Streptomyces sp. PH10-H1]MDJ0371662.1 tyrosine-type recombinase/integrase [Streptomyces sp. H10-C2]
MILPDPIKKLSPNAKGQVRYRFVVDVGIDPATGKGKQLTRTFDTLKEAKAEYAHITNRRHEGTFAPPNKITVNEWLDQWLAKKAEDLEETTIYNYVVTVGRVRGKLGHIRLQELTEDHVETWMTWALQEGRVRGGKAGTGPGVTSVEMSLSRLKDALNRAMTRRLVTVNVAQEIPIPRKARKAERKTKTVVQPWGVAEVHAFVLAVEDDRLYAPLLLSLMGLRPAEICGLRWADVALGKATLDIANTRTLMGNKTVVEKETKSAAGERQLPLPTLVREALKRFRATQVAEKLAAGEAYEDSGYVLVDELGRALNGRHLRVRAYKIMAENALWLVRLYDARASCFTYLANNGVPDHLLARWAGHTNVKTTKRWYVKPDVEDLRSAAHTWGGLASLPTTPSREKL